MTPLILAEPERPFWGFAELFVAAALFLASGFLVATAAPWLHLPEQSGMWSVIEEGVVYAVLFLALKVMFANHGKGVFDSLGWSKPTPFTPRSLAILGIALSLGVGVLEKVLRTPEVDTPFDKLLGDPASRIAVALFGITLAPIIEELLFRGFLQPVLTSSFGVLPGILATSAVFGAMHLMQNAFIWQSGVLIMVVGFVLGIIRHLSGSTRASTIVHIAYNLLPFLVLVVTGNPLTKK